MCVSANLGKWGWQQLATRMPHSHLPFLCFTILGIVQQNLVKTSQAKAVPNMQPRSELNCMRVT